MAVSVVGTPLATTATATPTISGAVDCTGADCLVAVFAWSETTPDAAPSSVTYNGVAMTLIYNQITAGGANGRVAMYQLVAPASGSHTLQATLPTNADELQLVGQPLVGVNQATPVGTPVSTNGLTTDPSVTVGSASGELVIDGAYIIDTGTATPTMAVGAGQTQIANISANATVVRLGVSREDGAASVTMSWTTNGVHDQWASGAVSFQAAPPASPVGQSYPDPRVAIEKRSGIRAWANPLAWF